MRVGFTHDALGQVCLAGLKDQVAGQNHVSQKELWMNSEEEKGHIYATASDPILKMCVLEKEITSLKDPKAR